jgi:monoterpene epsilon-lactone hydrolase
MASKQAEALKDLYRGWVVAMNANPTMGLDEIRDIFEHWGDVTVEPGGVDYIEVDAGGVPALWAVPKGCREDRVLICTHGGGYVTGSMYTHRKMFGHMAKAIGCRALILHYRRAPEHTHPAQCEDGVAAYQWLLDQGIKPAHVATTGDSAGGGLCTSLVLGARAKGLPLPAAVMPLSPWYDMEGRGGSLKTNAAADVLVQEAILMNMAATFLGSASKQDPLANPLYADLAGFPPTFIQVGADETLLDDSLRFAEKAKAAGVDVKCGVYPEMQHVFHFLAGRAPEADAAIAELAAWVRPKLGLA